MIIGAIDVIDVIDEMSIDCEIKRGKIIQQTYEEWILNTFIYTVKPVNSGISRDLKNFSSSRDFQCSTDFYHLKALLLHNGHFNKTWTTISVNKYSTHEKVVDNDGDDAHAKQQWRWQ